MTDHDVIVVGAGAAGAPLAARLSEDPSRRVLLLEAGADHPTTEGFPPDLLDAGLITGAMPGHADNWGFLANLTPHLPYTVTRGRILGGSTTINGTYFVRARRADFDRWVSLGNPEWTYEACLPFYRRAENDLTYGTSALHGGDGPMPVTRAVQDPHPVTTAFFAACAELGFTAEPDKNGEQPPGYGPLPVNAPDGVRVNTGIAYVNPARGRPNLTVRGRSQVSRIVIEHGRAVGVEVLGARGGVERITADEVVLAAGAIKTPHLLALSGIGPAQELGAAGIDVVLDSPGVGKGFSDHPDLSFTWQPRRRVDIAAGQDMFQAVLNFSSTGGPAEGDLEILPQLKPLGAALGIAPGTRTATMLRLARRSLPMLRSLRGASMRRLAEQFAHRNDMAISIAVQQAESRGTITTVSSDPGVQPRIEYHYLDAESDRRRMREVVRTTAAILQAEAFGSWYRGLGELDDQILGDDDALDSWMLSHLATAIHACGSARMGPDDDPMAVVDQFGRVRGLTGLRVADTSILPTAPSRGPAATAVMLGERIADFIAAGR